MFVKFILIYMDEMHTNKLFRSWVTSENKLKKLLLTSETKNSIKNFWLIMPRDLSFLSKAENTTQVHLFNLLNTRKNNFFYPKQILHLLQY